MQLSNGTQKARMCYSLPEQNIIRMRTLKLMAKLTYVMGMVMLVLDLEKLMMLLWLSQKLKKKLKKALSKFQY